MRLLFTLSLTSRAAREFIYVFIASFICYISVLGIIIPVSVGENHIVFVSNSNDYG